jgi:hypothetical protein
VSIYAPPKLHIIWVPGVDPARDAMVADMAQITDVCLHSDTDRQGVMWNWAQAVTCAASMRHESDWHFLVQDDQVPLRGWMQQLERAVTHSPTPLLGLQWIDKRVEKAAAAGVPYLKGKYVIRGGAVAYHHSLLTELAIFARQAAKTTYKHDDMAVCQWAVEWKGFLPSLVTHSIFASPKVKSLLGHAPYVTGDYTIESNPDVDWAAKPSFRLLNDKREDAGWLLNEMGWVSP